MTCTRAQVQSTIEYNVLTPSHSLGQGEGSILGHVLGHKTRVQYSIVKGWHNMTRVTAFVLTGVHCLKFLTIERL